MMLFISKKKLPVGPVDELKPVPPKYAKGPVRNVATVSGEHPGGGGEGHELSEKSCGPPGTSPVNDQTKSGPLGNGPRSSNPPELLGAKLRDASPEKPVRAGELNVTLMPVKSTKPPEPEDEKLPVTVEGTLNVKVNEAPGAETAVVEPSA